MSYIFFQCLCPGLSFAMLCNLNSSSLFTSLSQFYKQEEICRSVIVMPHALQYPSNISIPLRLSGHWQINHQHRSHSQTFPSHSQTFHSSTVTSAKQAPQTIPSHSNWLLEHQTWQILQGLQDITDIYPTLLQEGNWKKKPQLLSVHKCCLEMLWMLSFSAKLNCVRLRKWDVGANYLSAHLIYVGSKYELPVQ